ncbi:MAG: 5-formyltetrahydrofolate cyclo-ligase [Acetobacteraceae bacterium]|nr:5-formyltetrahydrofolate cyclo-ligase [Acetobacteraceae bacterium]
MVAPHFLPNLNERKRAARKRAKAAREGCDPALGGDLARHVLASYPPPDGAIVAGYWPMGTEIDILPLLIALHEFGHRIALPVTPKRGAALSFRAWHPGAAIVAEAFGTQRSTGEALVPDFLLVPLLAFDRAGRRLGYGGGYYDRTLPLLPRATLLGCGFAAQEVDEVPVGPYDIALPAIATERGVTLCEGAG